MTTPDLSDAWIDFSNHLAALTSRERLFPLLQTTLKRLGLPGEPGLILLDDQRKHFEVFLTEPSTRRLSPDDRNWLSTHSHPWPDGFFHLGLEIAAPIALNLDEWMRKRIVPRHLRILYDGGIRELFGAGIHADGALIGGLFLITTNRHIWTKQDTKALHFIATQLTLTIAGLRATAAITRLEKENAALLSLSREQFRTAYDHEEIVGSSPVLQRVFQSIGQVAGTTSTVLILGETGTGKELIARAIHNGSPRKDKPMIKVNCAALPANLVESELFGHEKGSFTGAVDRRIGKFELADNSSIFLDEIGELPPELQAKLLRAIQEKEIERIGGRTTIRTDARIIAATNRRLQEEVDAGRFRTDLYYRLNVFPIHLPPLRERREDIPALTAHFIAKYARRSGKKITGIAPAALRQMSVYHWPGNIRELEHLVERSILMTQGPIIREIHLPVDNKENGIAEQPETTAIKSLEDNERDHILGVLRKTKGRIRGKGGAAEILKLPPTTLHSRMKKLGITKKHE
ncbi:MAG TPA: sigma 54-interacting transcriptional regulator [Puia sp.]|uniref:sigma-54 interaction domain-containing protein n=1 Tax=Puia sp. TaxID=2045100 RepID=UPI002CCCE495|nr:sigma 54-interacting transcriptional regulator [Puia sp.]HVU93991.1 sigma 54-interacting transcriptional regulator [Puia sp.]